MLGATADTAVIISGPLLALEVPSARGQLTLARSARQPHLWAVERIEANGSTNSVLDREALERLGGAEKVQRAHAPAGAAGAQLVHDALSSLIEEAVISKASRRNKKANSVTIWAAITPVEEGPRRGERQRGWAFRRVQINVRTRAQHGEQPRSQALDLSVRQRRIPELRGLETMRFLVIGAGSLGGHIICELARAGTGELDVVDGDTYDINNSVRHVLPVTAAGRNKAEATRDVARALNPHGIVRAHPWNAGGGEGSRRALAKLIASADVVVDATASHDITRCCTGAARRSVRVRW